jgi:hypothetical protein
LTRPAGFVLLPALAWRAWRRRDRRAFAGLGLAVPFAAAWPVYLWVRFGHPLLFLQAEREGWFRHFSRAGPFGGAWDGIVAGWHALAQLVAPGGHDYFPLVDDSAQAAAINLECLAAAIFVVVLGIVAWRRLGAAYGIFTLGSAAVAMSSPAHTYPLMSMVRFVLGVFPVFLALGLLGTRRRLDLGITVVFTVLLGVNLARWVLWQFVA